MPRGGRGGQGICLAPVFDLGLAEDPGGGVMESFLEPSKLLSLGMGTPEPGNTPKHCDLGLHRTDLAIPSTQQNEEGSPSGRPPTAGLGAGAGPEQEAAPCKPGAPCRTGSCCGVLSPSSTGAQCPALPQYFRLAW